MSEYEAIHYDQPPQRAEESDSTERRWDEPQQREEVAFHIPRD